jgi:hypothetical protein
VLYRLLVGLATLVVGSGRAKDLDIVVLRHQGGGPAPAGRAPGPSPRSTDYC